jgi:hypothetical protein
MLAHEMDHALVVVWFIQAPSLREGLCLARL